MQRLYEHVPDGALCIRTAVVQRNFMQFVPGYFGAAQDKTNLRAIAMGNDDVISQ